MESDITSSKKTAIDSYQKMAQITGPTAELSSYISTIHHFESQQLLTAWPRPIAID
jgi:hypothetical protein